MPVRQYAYFALSSHSTSAAEMTAALGIEPDRTATRGSRRGEPSPVPVAHRWIVECRDPGLSVNEQIARILERLAPHTDALAALARRLDAEPEAGPSAVLEVVRYFNEAEQHPGHQAEPSKHEPTRTLGWHLGRDVLDFLQATGAVIDIDEYEEGS
jgi:hypothetical protein